MGELIVSGVTRSYAGRPVVSDLSLRVGPGEVVALVGPNGVGKTTLLRCALGVELPGVELRRARETGAAAHQSALMLDASALAQRGEHRRRGRLRSRRGLGHGPLALLTRDLERVRRQGHRLLLGIPLLVGVGLLAVGVLGLSWWVLPALVTTAVASLLVGARPLVLEHMAVMVPTGFGMMPLGALSAGRGYDLAALVMAGPALVPGAPGLLLPLAALGWAWGRSARA